MDGAAFGAEVVDIVKRYVERSVSPLLDRIAGLEQQIVAISATQAAQEARCAGIASLVADEAKRILSGWERPQDGKSVTIDDVRPVIAEAVAEAVKALPPAKDGERGQKGDPGEKGEPGRDGLDGAPGQNGRDAAPVSSEQIVEAVRSMPDAIEEAVRMHLEASPPAPGKDGRDGADGKNADPAEVKAMVDAAVAALPPPQAGKDADPALVASLVEEKVNAAVAMLPIPENGKSVTVEDVRPLIDETVGKAIAAIPAAKDGIGLAGMLIDREGGLVATMSDGTVHKLGRVVGKDGDNGKDGQNGKDGRDGFGFEDMDETLADDGRTIVRRYSRGEASKEFRHTMSVVIDRGVFKEGQTYVAGDGVTWAGCYWIAKEETSAKPDHNGGPWRLSVKKGRDGKDGVLKPEPPKIPVKAG